ncbi:MAG: HEAT repeat domain-containing protein [Planctomycetota bacterium]|nr:HEAT repeat domain-containing protein [Planctomycetota bacterium]
MPATPARSKYDALIDALDAEGERAPLRAVARLRKAGASAVPPLKARFDAAKHPRLRRWIANALGEIGDRRALPLLKRAVKDQQMSVRLHAMEALEKFGDRSLWPVLRPLLADPSGGIRARTISAVARLGWRQAVPALRKQSLRDEKWYVRQYAAQALAALGAKVASADLVALREDPSKAVRNAAEKALRQLKA